ncbi:MAG: sugar transferase [Acidimicrobiales bacterium]
MTTVTLPLVSTRSSYPGKRLFDLVFVLVVALPVIAVCLAIVPLVKATSSGPVFFRQERIGRGGRTFRIWKFRTMVHEDNPVVPTADRITPIGRFLRRTSLDELPQLLNVMTGDMSIVGPRPTLAYQAARWNRRQWRRLDERPGMTGLAQVSGRNALSWPERIEHDLAYVGQASLALDLRILARTAITVLRGEGAGSTVANDPIATTMEHLDAVA